MGPHCPSPQFKEGGLTDYRRNQPAGRILYGQKSNEPTISLRVYELKLQETLIASGSFPSVGVAMASPSRPFWTGYLKLSLVTCSVAMSPATSENEKVRFRTLNRKTGNPVISRYVDGETGKRVREDDAVKGYERGEGEYVILEDQELAAIALESARTIDIDTFAPADSIDWVWFDKPHFLTPNQEVGGEAFSVIRDAMRSTRTVGIARLVLYGRERATMLEPRDNGIILWTLRYGDEVRDPKEYFADIGGGEVKPRLMSLVTNLIEERKKPWSSMMVHDPVQNKLLDIIASKGKKNPKQPQKRIVADSPPSNVINIMDALRRSLSEEKKLKKH
jgi:DNA end-binding protein Ku